ncbi:nucleoside-diphosphate sugar epimerase/dehydratase [Victivallis sp. Marseille-Q1083]|uniref:polysaccharide biosynthesis protein n=1 Tax=Victivallis sp. Marseille-Q1083 TaxID=2717288 RepID=UPI00158E02C9|nr:nucleoside-diphosphate sugar epimerase/dehydratase [Victivallis sp. Marseille-Q1083]
MAQSNIKQFNVTAMLLRFAWLPVDIVILNVSYLGALWICSNLQTGSSEFEHGYHFYTEYYQAFILFQIFLFTISGMYSKIWSYASLPEFFYVIFWSFIYCAFFTGMGISAFALQNIPLGIYPLVFFFNTTFLVAPRLSLRIARLLKVYWNYCRSLPLLPQAHEEESSSPPTMLIGAGYAGRKLLAEIGHYNNLHAKPVVFIDDDPLKRGMKLNGIPVAGGRDMILSAVEKYKVEIIVVVMPSASNEERKKVLEICSQTKCKLLTVPSLREILEEKVTVNQIRNVEITDLLGRDENKLDLEQIKTYLTGKTILISGGGGSIGSELCRQIATFNPRLLIIFDIYENNAYDIELELRRRFPELKLEVLIGSLRDPERLEEVFSQYHPEIVFHAGAHKHVPLMEHSPKEAIKNNVFGTYHLASISKQHKVKRFILISTDKAVNPTNVMGASKRLCEMIIQSLNEPGQTEFAAVRFGNVLGSNGSVVPLFKRLIREGRPLPVTHPDITRYFMTIPEASRLVLQAGAMARGGEIFILDMGKPIKILSLAENLIRLSGLTPYEDINIEFIGLRPGEKLFEELSLAEEGMTNTRHQKIFISNPIHFDREALLARQLPHFHEIIENGDDAALRIYLEEVVSTYHPIN